MNNTPMNDNGAVIQSVGEQISVSSQLSPDQLRKLPDQGFKSVANLRDYQEESATADDHQLVESLGLAYVNLPIKPAELDEALIEQVLEQVHELPKPLLIYCGSSLRATFIALLYIATHHDLTLEAAKAKGRSLGFDFDSKPPFKHWLEKLIPASADQSH